MWPKKRPTLMSGTHPNASSGLAWPGEGSRKSQWPLTSPVDFTIWVPWKHGLCCGGLTFWLLTTVAQAQHYTLQELPAGTLELG